MEPRSLVRSVAGIDELDQVGEVLDAVGSATLGNPQTKTFLNGSWLGHPLHPALTDLPIGFFAAAVTLDLFGGRKSRRAAATLTALGVVSVVPTALSGLADWVDSYGEDKRVGVAHAATQVAATGLFALSLVSGSRRKAVRLAGAAVMTAGAYLGGHLTYARGLGVDHTAFTEYPSTWTAVELDGELEENTPVRGTVNGAPVMLVRVDGALYGLAETCSHAGGPLHEGEVDGELCVTCPWHGSRFRLSDGAVEQGPAAASQPSFDVREREGKVEVRLRAR